MEFIPRYIEGKNNPASIHYDAKELEPILSTTYGCIVYQEQVMQIVQQLGGYSLGRADLVRRAMSKKKQHVMEEERRNFVYGNPEQNVPGCAGRGIPEATANHIYDTMMDFAKYAFNKSHAACYAVVTYETAWLKVYYPAEFFAALLSSVIDFPAKVAGYILCCRQMGIRITPPDLNTGEADFSVEGGAITYALTAVKGIGRPIVDAIVAERKRGGVFRDLRDFLQRMVDDGVPLNKRALENLIKAGAMDCFGATRKQMMTVVGRLLDEIQSASKNSMAGQLSLFDLAEEAGKKEFAVSYPPVGEYDRDLKLSFEKEVLGVYLSGHPLDGYLGLWKSHITNKVSDLIRDEETGKTLVQDHQHVVIGGLLRNLKTRYTKKNELMLNAVLEDLTGSCEVLVWPDAYAQNKEKLQEDAKLFLEGDVRLQEDRDAVLAVSKIHTFEDTPRNFWIRFADLAAYQEKKAVLDRFVDEHGGRDQVIVYAAREKVMKRLPQGQGIRAGEETLTLAAQLFGSENVSLQ
jgi:DNA polymerase-3 subunit alpha